MAGCTLGAYLSKTGKSHSAFARELGVTDSAVWRWAHGQRSPSAYDAHRIEELTEGRVLASSWPPPARRKRVVRSGSRRAPRQSANRSR